LVSGEYERQDSFTSLNYYHRETYEVLKTS
jgi:hypothetical protein